MKAVWAIRNWYEQRRLSWIADLADIPMDDLSLVYLRGHSGMVPMPNNGGAILIWMFDQRDGANPLLIVRLTEDEADEVYAADPFTTGMLEPVRRHIHHRYAWMAVRCGHRQYVRPFRISRRSTEGAFVASLDKAADSCPAYHFSPTIKRSTAEVRATIRVVRQLATA